VASRLLWCRCWLFLASSLCVCVAGVGTLWVRLLQIMSSRWIGVIVSSFVTSLFIVLFSVLMSSFSDYKCFAFKTPPQSSGFARWQRSSVFLFVCLFVCHECVLVGHWPAWPSSGQCYWARQASVQHTGGGIGLRCQTFGLHWFCWSVFWQCMLTHRRRRRFWHATLRLRSAMRRYYPPQRAVLSQICCFGERKMVLFQILLDVAEPRDGLTSM